MNNREKPDMAGTIQWFVIYAIVTLMMVLLWPEVGPLNFFGLAQTIIFWIGYLFFSGVAWVTIFDSDTELPRLIGK